MIPRRSRIQKPQQSFKETIQLLKHMFQFVNYLTFCVKIAIFCHFYVYYRDNIYFRHLTLRQRKNERKYLITNCKGIWKSCLCL